jgi:hypothetical protein
MVGIPEPVNFGDGYRLTNRYRRVSQAGIFTGMGKRKKALSPQRNTLGSRIEARLLALGRNASEVSKAIGGEDLIRNVLRKEAIGKTLNMRSDKLEALARELQTTVEWLVSEKGQADLRSSEEFHLDSADVLGEDVPSPTVPLIGYVSAGAQAVLIHLPAGELDRVPAPQNFNSSTRALEVRGDSLGALFDRWLVFYDDVRSPITPDLINKLCIVGLADGRILIKKVQRNRDGGFDLMSNTEEPITGIVIEWAALVKSMEPK